MASLSGHSSDWAWLPKDLLYSTLDKLALLSDHVRFAAVCRPWRSIVFDHITEPPTRLPLLLIPTKDNSPERRSLYSVTTKKPLEFQVPVPYNRRVCGSSHGWLAIVDKFMAITLLNPFIENIHEFEDNDNYEILIRKVVLSTNPSLSPDNYEVVTIYGEFRSLAIIRPASEKTWIYIDNNRTVLSDVVYHKGQVYAICDQNGLISVDVSSIHNTDSISRPKAKIVIPRIWTQSFPGATYLVESLAGDLLLVQRWKIEKDHITEWVTEKFSVLKMAQNSGNLEWVKMKSLGDEALFLGDNYSMSVLASELPRCRSNSIYYTDDYVELGRPVPFGPRDTGIFNLDAGSTGQHYTPDPSQRHMPPPVWIVSPLRANWV